MQIIVGSGSSDRGKVQYDYDLASLDGGRVQIMAGSGSSDGGKVQYDYDLASRKVSTRQGVQASISRKPGNVLYDHGFGVTARGTSANPGRFRVISRGKGQI